MSEMPVEMINPDKKRLFMYAVKLEEDPGFDMSDDNGDPLYLDYSKLDWKALSKDLVACMERVPKSISVYFGNEPLTIVDIGINMRHPEMNMMGRIINGVLANVTGKDCRDGVMNLAPKREQMHPVKTVMDDCPPVMSIFFAIKATPMQMMDYELNMTRIFGDSCSFKLLSMVNMEAAMTGEDPEVARSKLNMERMPMQESARKVLNKHFGIEYSPECRILPIGSFPLDNKEKAA